MGVHVSTHLFNDCYASATPSKGTVLPDMAIISTCFKAGGNLHICAVMYLKKISSMLVLRSVEANRDAVSSSEELLT